jgi:hypothetical protein
MVGSERTIPTDVLTAGVIAGSAAFALIGEFVNRVRAINIDVTTAFSFLLTFTYSSKELITQWLIESWIPHLYSTLDYLFERGIKTGLQSLTAHP